MSVRDIDKGWKRIKKEMKLIDDSYVNVGVLSDAGSYEKGGGVNLADVATWNEFGTSKIPSRPFMRQTFEDNKVKVNELIKKLRSKVHEGKMGAVTALESLGVIYKGKIQKNIASGNWAPNAPSTISKKGSSKPLIDSGRLRQSINYEVKT